MEKNEKKFYVVTLISFVILISIVFGLILKIPGATDQKLISLSGNVFMDLEKDFHVGDSVSGNIIIGSEEVSAYGVLLLTKDGEVLETKTFNLIDVSKEKSGSKYSINLKDVIDYTFEEEGKYEIFFSVLDLDVNVKREFIVNA